MTVSKEADEEKAKGSLIPRWRGSESEGIRGKTTKPRVKDGATLTLRKRHATPFHQLFISLSLQNTSNFLLTPLPLKDKKDSSKRAPAESKMRNQCPSHITGRSLSGAYPGRDAEGLNLPQPIHRHWERDLRETRTTKTVCDKAAAS